VKTFAFHNKNIAKIIEILFISCERGKFLIWSHLFLQLEDVFAIIFANANAATNLNMFFSESKNIFRKNMTLTLDFTSGVFIEIAVSGRK
jgi:hypothetical protein